jgi:heparan-alpha-glucosaminide N-acetyltransferase
MAAAPPSTSPSPFERIVSIDTFRGLTMLLMLFVNDIYDADLGHIKDAPWWLRHVPPEISGMTMSDVIWPCFMFIIGLAIPLSLELRIARGDSMWKLSGHVLLRSLAMIFIGLCMVNGCHMTSLNEAAMGISAPVWRLLMFLGVILLWNGYPTCQGFKKWLFLLLRVAGAGLLVWLLIIYRANEGDHTIWMRTRWWGIIGQIGWAYLIAAFIWLACRSQSAAVMAAMALLMAINIAAQAGTAANWWGDMVRGFAPSLKELTWLSAITVAGMVIATLFRPNPTAPVSKGGEKKPQNAQPNAGGRSNAEPARLAATSPAVRIAWMLVFAVGFAAIGFLFQPLWGIHKPGGTPAWILYSLAIACAVYAFLYWLVDVKQIKQWTVLVGPAGSNTLLMYFLPQIFYSALAAAGVTYLQTHFCEGWLGVARSAVLAVCFVAITEGLTWCRIRLKL